MPKKLTYFASYVIVTGGKLHIIYSFPLFHSFMAVYTNSLLANLNARVGLRRKLGHIHMAVLKEIEITSVSSVRRVVVFD